MIRLERLDHLVLTVAGIARTCAFYERVLGMRVEEFDDGRKALHFGHQKINLHEAGHEFEPEAHAPTNGSADLCFIVAAPLEDAIARSNELGVAIERGPAARTGAAGRLRSVDVRDPDALLELATS